MGIDSFLVVNRTVCILLEIDRPVGKIPSMPVKTAERPSARDRLLEAADELFYAEGVHVVGVDRIVERAGVTKASLYNAFGSKEELVRAYLDQHMRRRQEAITRILATNETPKDRLLGVFAELEGAL